jgi:SAM-dependent methyltransferase
LYQQGLERLAKENKQVEIIPIKTGETVQEEAQGIKQLLSQDIDAIIMRPLDPQKSVPGILHAYVSGVVVVNIGDCLPKAARKVVFACYESDSFNMGYDLGQYIGSAALDNNRKQVKELNVGLVDGADSTRLYPYLQGFFKGMKDANVNNVKCIGIDINKESLGIANDLTIQHGVKNIKYLHSNLTDLLEIPSSYFDNAFSFHTLEHIHINDYDLVFLEWKRVIKNEGHFIISVPYEHAYDDPCHMNYFNESSISNLFVKYGFDIVEVYRDTRNNFDCLNLVCKNIKQEQPLLSILVCSLVERNNTFLSDLISSIEKQIIGKPVELLILSDNAKRPVGTKRNDLLNISKGRYVCFIDDDDRISETYVDDILQEIIDWSPDVIVFDAEITFNGINPKLVKYGREYDYCEKLDAYYRHPNHLMVHKKENITEYFRDVKTGEDDEWASRMLPRIITQSRINKVLYYYDYNTSTKKYFE